MRMRTGGRGGAARWALAFGLAAFVATLLPAVCGAASFTEAGVASGRLAAISCPTARLCYAAGDDRHGQAVFDTLLSGRQTSSRRVPGMQTVIDLSCPSRSFCLMTGDDSHGDPAIRELSHGRFAALSRPGFVAWRVFCPQVARCVIAGFGAGLKAALAAADVIGGRVGPVHEHVLGRPVTSTGVYGLSCASMSACEMVGTADVTTSAGIGSVYAKVGPGGRISGVHVLELSSDPTLGDGIACARSACYLPAGTQTQGLLLSVAIGGSSLTQVATTTMVGQYVSCERDLSVCIAAGVGTGAVPALEAFRDGQPQGEQDLPQLQAKDPLVGFVAVAMSSPASFVALATEADSAQTQIVTGAP